MKNLTKSIIGLAFGLFSSVALAGDESESITSRVSNTLQERIEYRMQNRLDSRMDKVNTPVNAEQSSQVRTGVEMQVEITDCPCLNLPMAGLRYPI
jgi:hypothetical protein